MIHINQSKTSSAYTSTMCSRRHKGMLQTSIILVLLVCIGYGFYLYSLLQVKVKYLDAKQLRQQSQQQSLSSQLQVVYEDRAQLEKAVQKSKNELLKTQEEFDRHRKEKEALIQGMLIEHQDKHQEVKAENEELKEKIKEHVRHNQDLLNKHDKVFKQHEQLKEEHQELINVHAESLKEMRDSRDAYEKEKQEIVIEKQNLEYQVQKAEKAEAQYQNLKYVLKALPADALNMDHPAVSNLGPNGRQILLEHLGEKGQDPDYQPVQVDSEEQRRQMEEEELRRRDREHVRQQLDLQQANKNEDKDLEGQNEEQGDDDFAMSKQPHPQMHVVDICSLPSDIGPCRGSEIRYYYHPILKECRGFTYGGCGGNENNFASYEECVDVCNDPKRRYVELPMSEEEQLQAIKQVNSHEDAYQNENDQGKAPDDDDVHHVNGYEEDQGQNQGNQIQQIRGDGDDDPQNYIDNEQQRLTGEEEERARKEEEAARRELENANKNQDESDQGDEDDDDDPLAKLKKISKEQMQVAKDQQGYMEKLIEHQQNEQQVHPTAQDIVEAKVEDDKDVPKYDDHTEQGDGYANEEGDEDEEEEEDVKMDAQRDEDDVQVAMPPAAQVAGQDPEAVMNRPPQLGQEDDGLDGRNKENIHEVADFDGDGRGNDVRPQDGDDDPLYEQGGNQDTPLEYRDDNQQEEGDDMAEDGNFNQDGDREDGVDHINGRIGNFGDEGEGADNAINEEDEEDYADEEDEEEERNREDRNAVRIRNDKQFAAMQQVENVLPQGVPFEREM